MDPRPTPPRDAAATSSTIAPGDFPFPLGDGPGSPYLTWLRNHSNYMAPRGLLDYFRAVGVLGRGMVVNFLIFLPFLLLLAIPLAAFHHWMLAHPFVLTATSAAAALAWVLLSPAVVQLLRVSAFRQSVETGNESSVRQRDLYERSFGAPLVAIALAAAIEAEPWILEFLHSHLLPGRAGWPGGVAAVSVGLGALGAANPLLSALRGFTRQLLLAAVGLVGLLIPLAVVLSAVDFLLYGYPLSELWALSPLLVPIVAIPTFVVALVLGLRRRAFTRAEATLGAAVLVGGLVFAAGAVVAHFEVARASAASQQGLYQTLDKVHELAMHLGALSNRESLSPETAALIDALVQTGSRAADAQQGPRDVSGELPLVVLAGALSSVGEKDLNVLTREFRRLAHTTLVEQATVESERARTIREAVLRAVVDRCPADPLPQGSEAPDAPIDTACVRKQLSALDQSFGEDLGLLVSDDELFAEAATHFAAVPEMALRARVAGRRELERLLNRRQLSALVEHLIMEGRGPLARREVKRDEAMPPAAQAAALFRRARPTWQAPAPDDVVRRLAIFRMPYSSAPCEARPVEAPGTPPAGGPGGDPAAGEELVRYLFRTFDRAHLQALLELEEDDPPAACQPTTRSWEQRYQDLKARLAPDSVAEFDESRVRQFVDAGRASPEDLAARAFVGNAPGPSQALSLPGNLTGEARPFLFTGRDREALLLAGMTLNYDLVRLAELAATELLERVLRSSPVAGEAGADLAPIVQTFATHSPEVLSSEDRVRVWVAARLEQSGAHSELATKLAFGVLGELETDRLAALKREVTLATFKPKALFLFLGAVMTLLFVWGAVDVNLTSIHGLFRDRLATAFLMSGARASDGRWAVDIADDVDLHRLAQHDTGSTAPYHLLNVALNLQQSRDINLRDRQSDFFIFSKRFIGGGRTGYCRSEKLEQVFPQMDLGTAMAVSAGAASPNMGRASSPFLRAFMTLLNVRLGFWVPNPGRLEGRVAPRGFTFDDVFREELKELGARWAEVGVASTPGEPAGAAYRQLREGAATLADGPDVDRRLTGLGFSGGGIRSATINLGITQVLDACGIFTHVDYMSTVSGGGCLGSSISTLMRRGGRDGSGERSPEHLLGRGEGGGAATMTERFRWRVPARAFIDEMLGRLNESGKWVNVSDGGHIENLAGMELLRRRCKYIILGDGEADPAMHFGGLAALMRYAWIDLGIRIDIDLDPLRLRTSGDGPVSAAHYAFGTIVYPEVDEHGRHKTGSLLYLKSSYTCDESEIIREYRHRDPTFPHQTTTDQSFDEDQFEAYRALGEHMATQALTAWTRESVPSSFGAARARMSFDDFERWMQSETAAGAAQFAVSAPASV